MLFAEERGPLAAEILPRLEIAPDREQLLGFLGYPADPSLRRPLPEAVEAVLASGRAGFRPRGVYAIHRVEDLDLRSLTLGGVTIAGAIGDYLRGAGRVAAFVVTAGGQPAEAEDRDPVSAWALDGLGSWAAEAAADALMKRIEAHLLPGEVLSLRYSPGYCGMDLAQQRPLFQLVQAEAIGVSLLPSLLMRPLKSISGLVGLGPAELLGEDRSPCKACPQERCSARR